MAVAKSLNQWAIPAALFLHGDYSLLVTKNGKKHEKQNEALKILADKTTNYLVYGGAAGGGKSWMGCSWLAMNCVNYKNTRWFIGRNELMDLEQSTLPTFYKVCASYGIIKDKDFKYDGQKHIIKFTNGSVIQLLNLELKPSDPDYEKLGSTEFTGGWIEEAGGVEGKAYEILKVRIGRWMNDDYKLIKKMLITMNPKKNWVYTEFYTPYKKGDLPENKKFLQALVYDNPHNESSYASGLEELTGINRERMLLGNWDYIDDEKNLCTRDKIDKIFTNVKVLDKPFKHKRISMDLAMQGRDRTVGGVWRGNVVDVRIDEAKSSGKSIEDMLRKLITEEKVKNGDVIVDSDGLGNYLQSYIYGINPFHGNARANKPEFANKKSECAYKLAELINNEELYIICSSEQRERLCQELSMLIAKSLDNDEKKKAIISKDDMKKKLGRSPDYLDMLIMGMDFVLKPNNIWFSSY